MENIVYYLVLYLFVIIIRFFKLKKQYGKEFNKKWYETFYGSLEIVYTASGFIIALLLNVPKEWIAAVIAVYLLIVVFSAFLEMSSEDEFKPLTRSIMHAVIILIISISTYLTFSKILPKVDLNGVEIPEKNENIDKTYFVIVPYIDNTLINHIGYQKIKDKYFMTEVKVISVSKDSAKIIA